MKVFLDTAGILALMDKDDDFHPQASACWSSLLKEELYTTNYVLVEVIALTQNRLGIKFVPSLVALLQRVEIEWVDNNLHMAGMNRLLLEARRRLSLVDCVSFEFMTREEISSAFTFDRHFEEAGFLQYPPLPQNNE
ncbi:MAG: type II toxin-antitoxin system VapC family toxin [Fimbriimonadia bacterium]|nr:type II toxin-antitoxin system VapC family toxin [Fimbriimonadia bacterium]